MGIRVETLEGSHLTALAVVPALPRLARVARFWTGVIAGVWVAGTGVGEIGTCAVFDGALRAVGAIGTGVGVEVATPCTLGGDWLPVFFTAEGGILGATPSTIVARRRFG